MPKFLSILLLIITIGTVTFSGCSAVSEEVEEDGGVTRYNDGSAAPKTITSEEVVDFNCTFSLINAVLEEESELDGRVYNLSAVLKNEKVNCQISWHDRFGEGEATEFTADASFMVELQEIISKYKFSQNNGYSHEISGLPDMYGSILDIEYKSGESIYAYDNQDCFIPFDAMNELVELFKSAYAKQPIQI